MDRMFLCITIVFIPLISEPVQSASFRFVNKCRYTVWPGLLSGANTPQLPTTGFTLQPGKSKTMTVPRSWSGRVWARTLCSQSSAGKFTCLTADCGSGTVECSGTGATPPATLAELTLNGDRGLDFYDVSLVDGYNLPMLLVAKGGRGGDCSATGCLVDLNGACPSELKVTTAAAEGGGSGSGNGSRSVGAVACKSACEAFGDPQYCCSGAYSTPQTCQPSLYSQFFKHACPRAYSYAYDDKTSTFTCASADYMIVFCPPPYTSQKLLGARRMAGELPLVNKTMMYLHASGGSSRGLVLHQLIACSVTLLLLLIGI
ncbi:hypothetical protein Ancab_017375 [Ancistrocladus abbreviatus]